MTYTARYRHLAAQRAYSRADLRTKLAPYRGCSPRPVVIPQQRRRSVARERISA
jgi:hypothetical protein